MQGGSNMNTHLPRGAVPRGARGPPMPQRPRQNLLMTPDDSDDQEEIVSSQNYPNDLASARENSSVKLDGSVEYFGAVLPREEDDDNDSGGESPERANNEGGRSPPTQRKDHPASSVRRQQTDESQGEDADDGDSKAFL
eukprot:1979676-Rhodomonas_salina.1